MSTATIHITPFHVGWRVHSEVSGRLSGDTVTGERARAIEIARYQATRLATARVVVHGEDGTFEEL